MVDIMYELPDQPKGSKYVIDDHVVMGKAGGGDPTGYRSLRELGYFAV